jgi:hypothetical protein
VDISSFQPYTLPFWRLPLDHQGGGELDWKSHIPKEQGVSLTLIIHGEKYRHDWLGYS